MENQLDFLVYKIIAMLILFGVLKLLFHAMYNYPISLIVRRYYFYGTLLILIIEGSIEELVFFLSMEIKQPFNFSISDKFTNTFMVMAFYLVILASVALFILFFLKYKKLIKYIQ